MKIARSTDGKFLNINREKEENKKLQFIGKKNLLWQLN